MSQTGNAFEVDMLKGKFTLTLIVHHIGLNKNRKIKGAIHQI